MTRVLSLWCAGMSCSNDASPASTCRITWLALRPGQLDGAQVEVHKAAAEAATAAWKERAQHQAALVETARATEALVSMFTHSRHSACAAIYQSLRQHHVHTQNGVPATSHDTLMAKSH